MFGLQDGITSDRYRDEYQPSFVEKWDELIDWDARARGEDGFFARVLREQGCRRVLDAAAGTGYHSVTLAREGFDVTAADGSAEMLRKTEENARKRDVVLPTVLSDWRELSSRVSTRFDAVLCLGNSFTHLFDESDRVAALAEFHQVLRPGGILIIDQRNYDRILDHGFSTKHAYYYCGRGVTAQPITVDASAVSFEYSFPDGSKHHLTLHPLRKQALTSLVHRVGFRDVETYGDFSAHWDLASTDFLVHVATKP